jgi:hypothetical protein
VIDVLFLSFYFGRFLPLSIKAIKIVAISQIRRAHVYEFSVRRAESYVLLLVDIPSRNKCFSIRAGRC